MTKKLALIFAATTWLVAGQATPARSVWYEGNALFEDCMSNNYSDLIACYHYVMGVADMVDTLGEIEVSGFSPICIPTKVSVGQLGRVVQSYLNVHPEKTHMKAVVLVVSALREAFPCP